MTGKDGGAKGKWRFARPRLRPVLRAVVDAGYLLIVARGSWRFAAVQFFTGGTVLHCHQTAGNRRPGAKHEPLSFAEAGLPTFDLRKPRDVAKTEKILQRFELSV